MALLSPLATSLLSAKDHAYMHRVIDVDEAATEGILTVDSSDGLNYGSATVDCGLFTMIKGAQTGDPQVQFALTADANGDFSITADTGDITLTAADDIFLVATGGVITCTGVLTCTSAALTTPVLGTPTSGTLTNCTGLPAASIVAGSFGTGEYTITSTSTTTSALLIDANGATGATGQAALRVDSENTDTAAVYITSAVDMSGTSAQYDDTALAVVSEGLGGCAYLHRNVSAATGAMLTIYDQHADSTAKMINVSCAQAASATQPAVAFSTTSAAHDQPVLQVTQAGTGRGVEINANGVLGSNQQALRVYTNTDQDQADGYLLYIHSDNAGSTSPIAIIRGDGSGKVLTVRNEGVGIGLVVDQNGAGVPLEIQQASATETNFKIIMELDGITVFKSDGTAAQGNLTGVQGDICYNGSTTAGGMAFCSTTGTTWTDM